MLARSWNVKLLSASMPCLAAAVCRQTEGTACSCCFDARHMHEACESASIGLPEWGKPGTPAFSGVGCSIWMQLLDAASRPACSGWDQNCSIKLLQRRLELTGRRVVSFLRLAGTLAHTLAQGPVGSARR